MRRAGDVRCASFCTLVRRNLQIAGSTPSEKTAEVPRLLPSPRHRSRKSDAPAVGVRSCDMTMEAEEDHGSWISPRPRGIHIACRK